MQLQMPVGCNDIAVSCDRHIRAPAGIDKVYPLSASVKVYKDVWTVGSGAAVGAGSQGEVRLD